MKLKNVKLSKIMNVRDLIFLSSVKLIQSMGGASHFSEKEVKLIDKIYHNNIFQCPFCSNEYIFKEINLTQIQNSKHMSCKSCGEGLFTINISEAKFEFIFYKDSFKEDEPIFIFTPFGINSIYWISGEIKIGRAASWGRYDKSKLSWLGFMNLTYSQYFHLKTKVLELTRIPFKFKNYFDGKKKLSMEIEYSRKIEIWRGDGSMLTDTFDI
ncbi:hypothetical protein LCGC14_2772330 [marine sediment metagenome]|uniref:Uncharacterized protein n=1 Tax=marine sediment metagenome TaxID=412755 RepID=A0A0F9B4G7_9ZZZZ